MKTLIITRGFSVKSGAGFTLVELLVVIAIIGILSSVAVISLNSSKQRARNAAVFYEMDGLRPAILVCLSNGYELYLDLDQYNQEYQDYLGSGDITETYLTMPLCPPEEEIFWPIFWERGWHYKDFTSDFSTQTWQIRLLNEDETEVIDCDQNGCIHSN